jgi:hypothetical protein
MRKAQLISITLACAYLRNARGGTSASSSRGGGGGGFQRPIITSGAPSNGTAQTPIWSAGQRRLFSAWRAQMLRRYLLRCR